MLEVVFHDSFWWEIGAGDGKCQALARLIVVIWDLFPLSTVFSWVTRGDAPYALVLKIKG